MSNTPDSEPPKHIMETFDAVIDGLGKPQTDQTDKSPDELEEEREAKDIKEYFEALDREEADLLELRRTGALTPDGLKQLEIIWEEKYKHGRDTVQPRPDELDE